MKHIKSHFELTNQQRNGILFLILIIIILQGFLFFGNSRSTDNFIQDEDLVLLEKQIDSIKNIQKEKVSRVSILPFNPNFLTDYRGYILGMSTTQIDNVLKFRKTGKWINSIEDFQTVSGVSDSLMLQIEPYIKFPDWVNNPIRNTAEYKINGKPEVKEIIDLNRATLQELKMVNGIGDVLAERIITYRNSFKGGFASLIELENVYGLKPEVISILSERFQVKTPRPIETINLNSADRDRLVSVPFIDYELAHRIVEYRILHEGFKSLDELNSVKGFPENKFEQIKLYLQLN
ncbi:helix-hairpin-helix domain-containing protein [Aegicerativicinus sediminis]|uniref:helix-hairpin-helix domain-containing protein n=1 Tax=Aegicerativicinus sediminis TaxID=2893202 RepID=UPI001E4F6E61|nr:helix-hairpin-helix domain-containing protein [Aegicerativicinus sediminis]